MLSTTTDRYIVDQIADALIAARYDPRTIKQWRYRGIPWQERAKAQGLAERHGVELPPDFLSKKRGIKAKPKKRARAA